MREIHESSLGETVRRLRCERARNNQAGTTFEGEDLELKDQNNEKTAIGNFFSTLHRFMTDDYYCLKPDHEILGEI